MNETFIPESNYKQKKWYLINAKNQQLGRLATLIVILLIGKKKPYFHPTLDIGDYLIIINAETVRLGDFKKFHVYCPGRPGSSLKYFLIKALVKIIIERTTSNMMPNGTSQDKLSKRLKIYLGSEHPHQAQSPIEIDLNNLDSIIYTFDPEYYINNK